MTKYLDKSFSVFPGSNKNYRDNWENIFKKELEVGDIFGRLTVLNDVAMINNSSAAECLCECGNITIVRIYDLIHGSTKSCGCLQKDTVSLANKTHGESNPRTPEHTAWDAMIQRCHNPNHPSYENYGGRGIIVCEKWRISYESFLEDVGRKPSKQHWLDRIDNNGNYEPDNVKWRLPIEQLRNTRRNALITIDGVSKPISQWAQETGVNAATIWARYKKYGWSGKEAVFGKDKDKKDGLKKLTEMSEEAGGYPELDLEPRPIHEAPPELLEKSGKPKKQPKTGAEKPKPLKKKKSRGKR